MGQEFMNHMMGISNKLNEEVGDIKKKKTEGKIPTHDDDEDAKIAKLTEQDDIPTDLEDEEDVMSPEEKPFEDEVPDEEETKIEKEYFGSKGDKYFYMNETQTDSGEREDLQIIDAEGEKVFSAIDNELDINDLVHFIVEATKQTDVDEVSRDIIVKYVIPALEEKEEEEEVEGLPPEEEETIPSEEEFESKVKFGDKEYIVKLVPDINNIGESKVTIGEKEFMFSDSFVNQYRNEKEVLTKEGIERLAIDVLEAEVNEKKPVPTCKKCGAKHWPMIPCKGKGKKKAKKESKTNEDKDPQYNKEGELNLDAEDEIIDDNAECTRCGGDAKVVYNHKTGISWLLCEDPECGEEVNLGKRKIKKESKIKEDLSADVKTLAKDAKAALDDEDYSKANELVQKLAQVQSVTPKVVDEEEPESKEELEVEEEGEERCEETKKGKIEEGWPYSECPDCGKKLKNPYECKNCGWSYMPPEDEDEEEEETKEGYKTPGKRTGAGPARGSYQKR